VVRAALLQQIAVAVAPTAHAAPHPPPTVRTLKSAAVPVSPAYRAAALAAAAAAACEPARPPATPDPCARVTFSADACQDAREQKGYYYHGAWVPHIYPMPYAFYLGGYRNYVAQGGRAIAAPAGVYAPRYQSTSSRAATYLDRVSGAARCAWGTRPGCPATPPGRARPGAPRSRTAAASARRGRRPGAGRAGSRRARRSRWPRRAATAGGTAPWRARVRAARRAWAARRARFSGVTHAAGSRAVSRGGSGGRAPVAVGRTREAPRPRPRALAGSSARWR
jgi:hypothetical protein